MKQTHPFSTEVPNSPPLNRNREIAAAIVLMAAVVTALLWWYLFPFRKSHELLHVSFDAARIAYKTNDTEFQNQQALSEGKESFVSTQTAGSIVQALGISKGLIADIASFASPMEVVQIQRAGIQIPENWSSTYPNHASPFYSTIVWLTKASAKIESNEWNSLLAENIRPCMPDPAASGAGRYAYFAIFAGFGEGTLENPSPTTPQADKLLLKTTILGDRASISSRLFLDSPAYNVLLTWESKALEILQKYPDLKLKIVYPKQGIKATPVVVELLEHTEKRNTRRSAGQYLNFLYSETAQRNFAEHGFRPANPEISHEYREKFPDTTLIELEPLFGSWEEMYENAFGSKGHFQWIREIHRARHGGVE